MWRQSGIVNIFNSRFHYILDVLSLNNSGFGDYLHLIYSKILWSSLWTGRQLQNIHISNDNGSFFLLHRIFSFLYQLQDFYETWIHTKTYVQMYMVSKQVFNIRSRNFLPYENTYVHPEYICTSNFLVLVEDQLSPWHVFLVFVRLFLCSPIHPFKHLIIFNVTNWLTLDGNINNFYAHARIRDPL